MKNAPKGKGYARAKKKLARMSSRGTRRRALVRQSLRVQLLRMDYVKRLRAWQEARSELEVAA